jgi:hypothetical protein
MRPFVIAMRLFIAVNIVAMIALIGCAPVTPRATAPGPQTIQPMCDQPRGALVYVVKDGDRVTALSAMPSACKAEAPKQP